MSVLRGLRLLLFGETWAIPIGVALVVGIGAAVRALAAGLWQDLGGIFLLVGIVAVLSASLALSLRGRGRGSGN
jgi:hypothetical protein